MRIPNVNEESEYAPDRYFTGTVSRGPWDLPAPAPEPPEWWLDLKQGLCIGGGASAVILLTVGLVVLWLRFERLWPV